MGESLSELEQALLKMQTQPFPTPDETDPRLLEALAILNQISNAINRIGSDDASPNDLSLQLIVESAIRVVPGSSAVIYTYDQATGRFESESRVSAEPEGRQRCALLSCRAISWASEACRWPPSRIAARHPPVRIGC